jgi:hypothetical protein
MLPSIGQEQGCGRDGVEEHQESPVLYGFLARFPPFVYTAPKYPIGGGQAQIAWIANQ